MSNIQFSLVCPSVRPQYWKEICESLDDNKLNWEILFIGPSEPIETLHSNAQWIKTSVKPSQCTHIGFLEAKGEYVSLTADDVIYFTPNHKGALDNMYEFIKNFPENEKVYNKEKMAYGFRMFEDQFCAETTHTHYIVPEDIKALPELRTSFLIYPFFVIKREVYLEIGGYDTRFISGQAETDFLIRIGMIHGHTQSAVCPTAAVWALHDKHNNLGSFRTYHQHDCEWIKKFWISEMNGKFTYQRVYIDINKYINDTSIYTISQGENGEWI